MTSGGASPFSRGFETTQIGGGVWTGISGAHLGAGVERDVVVVEELAVEVGLALGPELRG